MDKITLINQVIKTYFDSNKSVNIIPAKDLMPVFIDACIFEKDHKGGLPIRKIFRKLDAENKLHLIPTVLAERKTKNTHWYFQRNINIIQNPKPTKALAADGLPVKSAKETKQRDEDYVLDLCDEILKLKGSRQHKFDFLLGDSGTRLPVDIYYEKLNLVIEYREYQHSNSVKHFDKPEKITVSGVHRGEQRKIYDQRRRDVLPTNRIKLIEIDYSDFECDKRNRIVRDKGRDLEIVKTKVSAYKEL